MLLTMTDLLTLPEAAAELGLTRSTLQWQIKLGRLQATKPGRDWLVTRSEVERYRRESLGRAHLGRPRRDQPVTTARSRRRTHPDTSPPAMTATARPKRSQALADGG